MIRRLFNWDNRPISVVTGQPIKLVCRDRIDYFAILGASAITPAGNIVRTHYGEFLNALDEQGYADSVIDCINDPASFSREWNTWIETEGMSEEFPIGMIDPEEHGYVECEACGEWHKRDENADLIDHHFCESCG